MEEIIAPHDHAESLADRLISEFGTLSAVLGASPRRLRRAISDETVMQRVRWFGDTMRYVLSTRLPHRAVLSDWTALLDYLSQSMAHSRVEQARILYLDVQNGLILDEVAGTGTIDSVPLHAREVVGRALELGAAALILAHNHPSGDPSPSRADVETTRQLVSACKLFGIVVHDHLIIGGSRHLSLRAHGLM